jgi:SOS-response transcriptional repressor LexA
MTGTENGRSPSILNMVVTLEKRGFIRRTPGASRSIQLLLSRDQLPDLT